MLKLVLFAQGVYFLVTGLWPLVHLPSFEAITAPKVDKWLVRMVGALAVAIAVPLLVAAQRGTATLEIGLLGALAAISFAAVDVVYVARKRIRPIYLGDAAVEALLLIGWALGWSSLR